MINGHLNASCAVCSYTHKCIAAICCHAEGIFTIETNTDPEAMHGVYLRHECHIIQANNHQDMLQLSQIN